MLSIIYSSVATTPFDDQSLADLLTLSRTNNSSDGVTGMLLYRDGHFLQVLEGDYDAVRAKMAVIAADDRHSDVTTLLEEVVSERRFPEWTMGYRPVAEHEADDIPGYRTTFDDIAGRRTGGGTLLALRQVMGWFQAQPG
ncbi:BLUF domain-containing protein [Frondihabitans peucedani]|uniref:BLUF domain-containing protein n=1 Tax=Frondihabitans peucedani TaxID=598626 RepID=A0ABP8E5Q5_9MICO